MNSNESLGNHDLLFEVDQEDNEKNPFISGASSSRDNLNSLSAFNEDFPIFASEAMYETSSYQEEENELGQYGIDASLLYSNNPQEPSQMFGYNPIYDFDFDGQNSALQEPTMDQMMDSRTAEAHDITNRHKTAKKPAPKKGKKDASNETALLVTGCADMHYEAFDMEMVDNNQNQIKENPVQQFTAQSQHVIVNEYGNQREHYREQPPIRINSVPRREMSTMNTAKFAHPRFEKYVQVGKNTPGSQSKLLLPVKLKQVLPDNTNLQYKNVSSPYPLPTYRRQFSSESSNSSHGSPTDQTDETGCVRSNNRNQLELKTMKNSAPKKSMRDIVPRDTGSNQIRCNMCKASFGTKLALEFHEIDQHAGVYAFKCQICEFSFASLECASAHVSCLHGQPIAPLYDKNILGHGLNHADKRTYQRRITGMIFGFVEKYLGGQGLLTGQMKEDNELIQNLTNKMYRPPPPPFRSSYIYEPIDAEMEEIAGLNQMLKAEYIYGQSIFRVPVESVIPELLINSHEESDDAHHIVCQAAFEAVYTRLLNNKKLETFRVMKSSKAQHAAAFKRFVDKLQPLKEVVDPSKQITQNTQLHVPTVTSGTALKKQIKTVTKMSSNQKPQHQKMLHTINRGSCIKNDRQKVYRVKRANPSQMPLADNTCPSTSSKSQ